MKEFIVVTESGVDISEIDKEMIADTSADEAVLYAPDRKCEIVRPKTTNTRVTHFNLTDEEAKALRGDARIKDVHIKPHMSKAIMIDQESNFSRNDAQDDTFVNWGLKRHIDSAVDTDALATPYDREYGYNYDGTGVDIVIHDDGIQVDHPEFNDSYGNSRVKQIDWYAESGIIGYMPPHFYSTGTYVTANQGGQHGTHVASVAAGKTYGWAKNANIYSMRIFGGAGYEIDYSESFDLIREWHNNKPIDPVSGTKRPTIVNQSWGFAYYYDNKPVADDSIVNIYYKGVDQGLDGDQPIQTAFGMVYGAHPINVPSIDVEQEQLTDAGIICVHAAGNSSHAQTSIHPEYNTDIYDSYYTREDYFSGSVLPGDPIYYNRAMSPNSRDTITVGELSNVPQGLLEVAGRKSERGPIIDVWAAGTNVVAATSDTSSAPNIMSYPSDSQYNIASLSGSSIATPQVAGVLCLLAQIHPNITPNQCKDYLKNNATTDMYETGQTQDWTDHNSNDSVYGAPTRVLHWPHGTGTNTIIEGDTDLESTNIS